MTLNPNPSPELLPCPFCGGEAAIQLDRGRGTVGVGCTKCTACQPPSWDIDSETWARRAWNTRALSPQTLPATGEVERAAVVAYIRRQSDRGADIGNEKPKGSTARAAFGGGSLALKRVADNIEAGEHILNDNALPATVSAANDEGVALDWRAVAKLAGEHGVRYRTNTALEKFLAAIRLLSQGGGK